MKNHSKDSHKVVHSLIGQRVRNVLGYGVVYMPKSRILSTDEDDISDEPENDYESDETDDAAVSDEPDGN